MKKVFSLLLIMILCVSLTACGEKKETNNNKDNNNPEKYNSNNNENQKKYDLLYFETEVKKIDPSLEKTEAFASMIGAENGYKLKNNDYTVEIYLFDKSSSAYKTSESKQKIIIDGFGEFDAIVKNGYALVIDSTYNYYNQVKNIFDKLN